MSKNECAIAKAVGIRFSDLGVIRGDRVILDDVTAEAPAGSATVIVGPNGAGKTTLIRCLLGECPYQGSISYFLPSGAPCSRPVIGYVPQQLTADAQMPLRVYEFMALRQSEKPLWLGCSAKSRKKNRQFLELVGAAALESQRLGALSGGELRRVLLASALSRKPDLLILDEAEAGVDYRGERLFWQLLDKMRQEFGFTLLMVSHNLPLAAHYATHVICIRKTLMAEGTPEQALTGENLLTLFGVPIHLYPAQCDDAGPACASCRAYGHSPYMDIQPETAKRLAQ